MQPADIEHVIVPEIEVGVDGSPCGDPDRDVPSLVTICFSALDEVNFGQRGNIPNWDEARIRFPHEMLGSDHQFPVGDLATIPVQCSVTCSVV